MSLPGSKIGFLISGMVLAIGIVCAGVFLTVGMEKKVGEGLVLVLSLFQVCLLAVVVVPFVLAVESGNRYGQGLVLVCACMVSFLIVEFGVVASSRCHSFVAVLAANLVVLAFVVNVTLFFLLFRQIGIGSSVSHLLTGLVATAAIGMPFWVNPLVEVAGKAKGKVIAATLHISPLFSISHGAFGIDLLRWEKMYEISVIGAYYKYRYPGVLEGVLFYLLTALGLCLLIGGLRLVMKLLRVPKAIS